MDFLLNLAFNYNSCLYGTFLYNCELERFEKSAKLKTTSIWTDVLKNVNKYHNDKYNPVEFICPNSSPYKMRIWEEVFFKFNPCIKKKNTKINQMTFNHSKPENFSVKILESQSDSFKSVENKEKEFKLYLFLLKILVRKKIW